MVSVHGLPIGLVSQKKFIVMTLIDIAPKKETYFGNKAKFVII